MLFDLTTSVVFLKVHFEHIFGLFRVAYFEIPGQVKVELGKLTIWDDFVSFLVKVSNKYLLSGSVESELLFDQFICALFKYFIDFAPIVKLDSKP